VLLLHHVLYTPVHKKGCSVCLTVLQVIVSYCGAAVGMCISAIDTNCTLFSKLHMRIVSASARNSAQSLWIGMYAVLYYS
jgi:hypothetical protein